MKEFSPTSQKGIRTVMLQVPLSCHGVGLQEERVGNGEILLKVFKASSPQILQSLISPVHGPRS